ncbi:MAG: AMP-binding protein [Candidatus Lokiarchaeota archaeon]|nr:AMP-binding protein [Candidatus Lokiarchaeota archaeon]
MKSGKGKISKKKSGNRGYSSLWVYIPSKISKDPSFPFRDKEEVNVELRGGSIIIKKSYDLHEITERFGIEDATVARIVEDKALLNKGLPFLYFKDQVYSYQDVNNISNRYANGLLKLLEKLKLKTPKIAVLFPNCPEILFTWFAIAKIGAMFVSINMSFRLSIIEYILKNSDTEIIIIDYEFYKFFKEYRDNYKNISTIIIRNVPKTHIFNDDEIDFNEIISEDDSNPNIDIRSHSPLEISYTSGTTGNPKGVFYWNFYTLSGITVGREFEELGPGLGPNKFYCPLPLAQALARYLIVIPAMYYNKSIVLTEKFDVNTFWDDIDRYKPDCFCYYSAYLSELVNQPPSEKERKHSIKYAFGPGALKTIWDTIERRFGIQIIEFWTLIEGVGIAMNILGSKGGKSGSVGKPAKGYEIKIVDSKGNELPPGRDNIGEICSRAKLPVQFEYYNLEDDTSMKIGPDRWVFTGDFGYKDHEGYIYFLGRKDDMIERNNEIFFAMDVERVANSHPLVVESAVFEVIDKTTQKKELKICVVQKKKGALSYEQLYEFMKEKLAYFMVPRYIEFRTEIPKNPNQFIQRFLLKEEWLDEDIVANTYDAVKNRKK